MANSSMEAKQLFAEATAEANALSNKPAATWDMGKRWDAMSSIEKLQDKLSKMGVHSVLIMVAENPKKQPTRKMHSTGGLNELIHNSAIGKAFAVELLKFNPKWSEPKTFVSKKRKLGKPHPDLVEEAINDEPNNTDSQGVLDQQEAASTSNSPSDSQGAGGQQQRETPLAITNGRPSTPAFGSSSVDHLLSKAMRPTLDIQMESNMAVAGPSQTAGLSMPLAGPSQTAGVSNICANYEDLLADFHMQKMERFRNPVTAFSYRFNGQTKEEYIVGPVRADPKVFKGSKLSAYKDLMTDRRPLSATIYALVRDAVALLEGGQGSLNDIVEKLYESQFIKRTYGSKTAMKPKLVVALSSYIIPKLLVEDNPCVSINRISNGLSEKTIYSYKFLSYNKEDLEKIAEEDCKGKKKSVKRRKTQAALSDLDVNGKLPNTPPSTPSPVPTTAFPKTLMASTLDTFERNLPCSVSARSSKALLASSSATPLPVPTMLESPETPTKTMNDTLEAEKTADSSPCEKNSVIYLLGGEDIPNEDRIYKDLPASVQKVTDQVPRSEIFFFSVPKTWSDSEFINAAIELIQKIVDE